MGQRIYLPIGYQRNPYPSPQTEREDLLSRLWETRTLLPGARTMEVQALRDYVQAQEQKIRQGHYNSPIPKPVSAYEREQAIGILKERLAWLRRRKKD